MTPEEMRRAASDHVQRTDSLEVPIYAVLLDLAAELAERQDRTNELLERVVANGNAAIAEAKRVESEWVQEAMAERDKYRTAAAVLCGAHIGLSQKACPACARDRYRAALEEIRDMSLEEHIHKAHITALEALNS